MLLCHTLRCQDAALNFISHYNYKQPHHLHSRHVHNVCPYNRNECLIFTYLYVLVVAKFLQYGLSWDLYCPYTNNLYLYIIVVYLLRLRYTDILIDCRLKKKNVIEAGLVLECCLSAWKRRKMLGKCFLRLLTVTRYKKT